jgi:hypothetical protein
VYIVVVLERVEEVVLPETSSFEKEERRLVESRQVTKMGDIGAKEGPGGRKWSCLAVVAALVAVLALASTSLAGKNQ